MDNLDEMDKFLETYSLPKLSHEETDNLNRPITRSEIESVILKTPANKSPGLDVFTGELHETYIEELILSFSGSSKRTKRRKQSQTHSMKPPSP